MELSSYVCSATYIPPLCTEESLALYRAGHAKWLRTFSPSISSMSEGSRFCIRFASFTPSSKATRASTAVQATTLTLYRTRDAAPTTTYRPVDRRKSRGNDGEVVSFEEMMTWVSSRKLTPVVLVATFYALLCG